MVKVFHNCSLLILGTMCLCSAGREQAEFTGQRLAALGLKYDIMVHSTMARATETANIISKYLPGQNHRPANFTAEAYAGVYTIFSYHPEGFLRLNLTLLIQLNP